MIITVFGATGQVGKRMVSYALAKGHTVRAFGRNADQLIDEDLRNNQLEAIRGSVFEEDDVYQAIEGADAVLSALGGSFDGTDKTRSLGIKTIVAQMHKAGVQKIIALGGSGVLSATDGTFLIDQADYPDQYLPVGREHMQAYLHLENSGLDWTFVCPPEIKDKDATERYITNDTYTPVPDKQYINAGDIAHFVVNELEQPQHSMQRVGISAL